MLETCLREVKEQKVSRVKEFGLLPQGYSVLYIAAKNWDVVLKIKRNMT